MVQDTDPFQKGLGGMHWSCKHFGMTKQPLFSWDGQGQFLPGIVNKFSNVLKGNIELTFSLVLCSYLYGFGKKKWFEVKRPKTYECPFMKR